VTCVAVIKLNVHNVENGSVQRNIIAMACRSSVLLTVKSCSNGIFYTGESHDQRREVRFVVGSHRSRLNCS